MSYVYLLFTDTGSHSQYFGRMMSTVYIGQAIGRQISFHLISHTQPILITICLLSAVILIVTFVYTGSQKKPPPAPTTPSTDACTSDVAASGSINVILLFCGIKS